MSKDNKTILIVEDDIFIADLYSEELEGVGYDVTVAHNGVEGLELLNDSKNYDLVLLDLMMPKMGGIDMLKKLRTEGPNKNVKVVILTNFSEPDLRAESSKLGVEDYWMKFSYTPDKVLEGVQKIFAD